jgi:hypothetical protein
VITAAMSSAWSPGASDLTFFGPVAVFVVVAAILYLLFLRPHKRVPESHGPAFAHAAGATPVASRPDASASVEDPAAIRSKAATPERSAEGDGRADAPPAPERAADGTEAGE